MFAAFVSGFKVSDGKNDQVNLIRADMNDFCRCGFVHEWVLAASVNGLYCSTRAQA